MIKSGLLTSPTFDRRRLLQTGAGAVALMALSPRRAGAQLKLDITQGNVQPIPIAIPPLLPVTPDDTAVAAEITQVITNNLRRSGLFAPIDPAAYIEKINNVDAVPQFDSWRVINAQALVTGRVRREAARVKADFRLWDVFAGQQLTGQQYNTTAENTRRVAHIISDAIYSRITGDQGYFDSRVVFVDETGSKNRRVKRLAIMDQDGAGVRYLTRGDDLVLTPRFSPTTQEITYMSYGTTDPRVYLLNIETGQREIVGNFPGMTFSPRFSPDGQRVIMSLQQGGNSNLFIMDLRSKATTRLTDTPAIDTAPSFAPDGSRICFEIGPRRLAADLCDGRGRRRCATHQFRRGFLFYAGVVPPRRLHRLHQARRRPFRHRHHAAGWSRRAHPHRRLPQRRPDLLSEWTRGDVLPRRRR